MPCCAGQHSRGSQPPEMISFLLSPWCWLLASRGLQRKVGFKKAEGTCVRLESAMGVYGKRRQSTKQVKGWGWGGEEHPYGIGVRGRLIMALLVMWGDLYATQGYHSSQEFRAVKVPGHHIEAQKGEMTYSRTHGPGRKKPNQNSCLPTASCSLLFNAALGSSLCAWWKPWHQLSLFMTISR